MLARVLIWAAIAFVVWIVLLVVIGRLGVRKPAVFAAVLSWLVAGLVIWGAPSLSHWIHHLFAT